MDEKKFFEDLKRNDELVKKENLTKEEQYKEFAEFIKNNKVRVKKEKTNDKK